MLLASVACYALVLILVLAAGLAHAAVPPAQRVWLVALYDSTQEEPGGWLVKTNWKTGDPCDNAWHGVVCNGGNTSVIGLTLGGNFLRGTLPATPNWATVFPDMESIRLAGNLLRGPVPDVSGFAQLKRLMLTGNRSGVSPGLTHLTDYHADINTFTGPIPALTALPALKVYAVSGNQLSGSIPDLSDLTALQDFHVHNNLLDGSINTPSLPASLLSFRIDNNHLTGTVPLAPALLEVGRSKLCGANHLENDLSVPESDKWNTATGQMYWYDGCTYVITPNPGPHGVLTPANMGQPPPKKTPGTQVVLTAGPDAYYLLDTLTSDCPGGMQAGHDYALTVQKNCTVSATFRRDPTAPQFTVTASAGANGAIAPAGATQVYINDTLSLTLTPALGYRVDQVTGTCGGTLNGHVFITAAVTQNCTVVATFMVAAVVAPVAIPALSKWALACLALLVMAGHLGLPRLLAGRGQ